LVIGGKLNIIREKDQSVLEESVAKRIVESAQKGIARQGSFNVALSGGSSPVGIYTLLATKYYDAIEWSKVSIFWVDDRYVEFSAPESNFGAFIQLFPENFSQSVKLFPMYQKGLNYRDAASLYESKIMAHFKSSFPKFDLVILGVGPDGHTASLFPNTPILDEARRLVKENDAPDYAPIKERVSFTYSLINDAKEIFTLLTGETKRAVLESLQGNLGQYPIERVKKENMCFFTNL